MLQRRAPVLARAMAVRVTFRLWEIGDIVKFENHGKRTKEGAMPPDNIANMVSAIQKIADAKSPREIPSQVGVLKRGLQNIGQRLAHLENRVAALERG